MVDWKYSCFVSPESKTGDTTALKGIKEKCLYNILKLGFVYINQGFSKSIVSRIVEKKVGYLMEATTKQEIDSLMQLSISYFKDDAFCPNSQYQIEEEELILLYTACCLGQLNNAARDRYLALYKYCKKHGEI